MKRRIGLSTLLASTSLLIAGEIQQNLVGNFTVNDGLIYQVDGAKRQLLGKEGLPFNTDKNSKEEAVYAIKAISTDGHAIYAIDESNRLYEGNIIDGNLSWTYTFGLPAPVVSTTGPLHLPQDYKAFAGSQRAKENYYYQDYRGNQFHYGTTGATTLYVLMPNGRDILMGDPWFPPDLSRQVCGPKRNSFQMENIAASSSTLFVIGKKGRMFTRFYDYDISGGTPFFRFSYDPNLPLHGLPGTDLKSQGMTRQLPLSDESDWREQETINLSGNARITKNISIHQNGRGNESRELRVIGQNQNGQNGYYYKQVYDKKWNFKVTDVEISPADFIKYDIANESLLPFDQDFHFEGSFNKNQTEITKVYTDDYNFNCSPINFNIVLKTGEQFKIKMHTVDSWTTFPEENVLTSDFAIKKLKGTLELPKEVLNSNNPSIKKVVDKYFKNLHFKSFKFALLGNKKFIEIKKIDYPITNPFDGLEFDLKANPNDNKAKEFNHFETEAKQWVATFKSQRSLFTPEDKIKIITDAFNKMRSTRDTIQGQIIRTGAISGVGPVGTGLANIIMGVGGLFNSDAKQNREWVNIIEEHLGSILHNQYRANELLYNGSQNDFNNAGKVYLKAVCDELNVLRKQNETPTLRLVLLNNRQIDLKWANQLVLTPHNQLPHDADYICGSL